MVLNDGFSNRETWFANDYLLGSYYEVMIDRGDTFPDEFALSDYLQATANETVRAAFAGTDGGEVEGFIDAALAWVEWQEIAAKYAQDYPELIEGDEEG